MATQSEMAAARRQITEIVYTLGDYPGELPAYQGGWINGKVILKDGRTFAAGGGWIDGEGLVETYNYRDAGHVDELAAALGLDIEDTMQLLHEDCPAEWPIKDR